MGITHDDGSEADGQAAIKAGEQGSQAESALLVEKHQPDMLEASEELIEKFQMMLHLPNAQVWNPTYNADTYVLPV